MGMFNYLLQDENTLEFVSVGDVADLPIGERLFVEIDRLPLVVFNLGGSYFAIADLCSHDDGPLGDGDLDGNEIICPRHGARFDLRNGKALCPPAVEDIPAYPVRVSEGEISVGIPRNP